MNSSGLHSLHNHIEEIHFLNHNRVSHMHFLISLTTVTPDTKIPDIMKSNYTLSVSVSVLVPLLTRLRDIEIHFKVGFWNHFRQFSVMADD